MYAPPGIDSESSSSEDEATPPSPSTSKPTFSLKTLVQCPRLGETPIMSASNTKKEPSKLGSKLSRKTVRIIAHTDQAVTSPSEEPHQAVTAAETGPTTLANEVEVQGLGSDANLQRDNSTSPSREAMQILDLLRTQVAQRIRRETLVQPLPALSRSRNNPTPLTFASSRPKADIVTSSLASTSKIITKTDILHSRPSPFPLHDKYDIFPHQTASLHSTASDPRMPDAPSHQRLPPPMYPHPPSLQPWHPVNQSPIDLPVPKEPLWDRSTSGSLAKQPIPEAQDRQTNMFTGGHAWAGHTDLSWSTALLALTKCVDIGNTIYMAQKLKAGRAENTEIIVHFLAHMARSLINHEKLSDLIDSLHPDPRIGIEFEEQFGLITQYLATITIGHDIDKEHMISRTNEHIKHHVGKNRIFQYLTGATIQILVDGARSWTRGDLDTSEFLRLLWQLREASGESQQYHSDVLQKLSDILGRNTPSELLGDGLATRIPVPPRCSSARQLIPPEEKLDSSDSSYSEELESPDTTRSDEEADMLLRSADSGPSNQMTIDMGFKEQKKERRPSRT